MTSLSVRERSHSRQKPSRWLRRHRRGLLPYVFLLPAILAIGLIHLVPMIAGVGMSLLSLTQFTIANWTQAPFIGFHNYSLALSPASPIAQGLLSSFGVTLAFTFVTVGISWTFGIACAVFLSDEMRFRRLLRGLVVIPYAIPAYVGAITWTFMLRPDGLVDTLLGRNLHILPSGFFWLGGWPTFVSIVVTTVWRSWPFAFLMLLAGVQSIPRDHYEAATVDGASKWQEFLHITLPQVRSVSVLLVLITGFWTFNDFTTPYIMFGSSPPATANLLSINIYNNSFVEFNFGLGSAMSVLAIAFLIVASVIYVRMVGLNLRPAESA